MRLDVCDLARQRALWSGHGGTWAWTNTVTVGPLGRWAGGPVGQTGYRTEVDTLVLDYILNGMPRRQRVPILTTPCTCGGTRPWFDCPDCAARVEVPYLRRRGFYCRTCAWVAYRSQSEHACGRSRITQQKAEPSRARRRRPKGIDASTRTRLLLVIFECEEVHDTAIADFMARHPLA